MSTTKYGGTTTLGALWAKVKAAFGRSIAVTGSTVQLLNGADTPAILSSAQLPYATASTGGMMTDSMAQKLDGVAAGAEANQNAFSTVKVGSTNIAADSKTDTLTVVAGSNVTLTPDATNDKLTIAATDTTYPTMADALVAGQTDALMPVSDYSTLMTAFGQVAACNIPHATCTTAPGVAAKVATLDNSASFLLSAGSIVAVTFTYGNSAATPTLNVNGTGAKDISIPSTADGWTPGSGTTINSWGAYETLIFAYTGSRWVHSGSGYFQYQTYVKAYAAAPKASPALTGTPTAPTAAAGTSSTQIATCAFVGTAISNALANVTSLSYEVVSSLPATGEVGKIYLVAHSHGTGDAYDEYIWVGSGYEKIGSTDVDLSGYVLTSELVEITASEVDGICTF